MFLQRAVVMVSINNVFYMMLLERSAVVRCKNNYCWLTCDSVRIPQPHYHVCIPAAVITILSTVYGYNTHRNVRGEKSQ